MEAIFPKNVSSREKRWIRILRPGTFLFVFPIDACFFSIYIFERRPRLILSMQFTFPWKNTLTWALDRATFIRICVWTFSGARANIFYFLNIYSLYYYCHYYYCYYFRIRLSIQSPLQYYNWTVSAKHPIQVSSSFQGHFDWCFPFSHHRTD